MTPCLACRQEPPDGSRFCPLCGAALSAPAAADPTGPYHATGEGPAAARFDPGQVVAGRYRVVSLLGRGGMGEVYRADDLTLGQPVALKFLPSRLAADPERLARFRREVAQARRVSHPNVCRVHDIADADGLPFLIMEYIDGEDLASLLKRVGRLPEEKGVEIARQLCAALGAVHDQGLLHRDLKPGNVMLDGAGRVRLTDFGLAAAAGDAEDVRSGTPAYMAPEQLAGKEVTARSDLFALGLVLYEVFTGRRPFPARDRQELARLYDETPPSRPSSHVSGIAPAVERSILRCLERSPADRPASAYEVLTGLPGGDPVAAALAAGNTPSPQMVAEGGESGLTRPGVALLLVGVVAAGMALFGALNETTALFRVVPTPEPPEELARTARQLLRDLGHAGPAADSAYHFRIRTEYLNHVKDTDPTPERWEGLGTDRPAALYFFYRESPEPMAPGLLLSDVGPTVTPVNPPRTTPGMAYVELDGQGRLLGLHVVPSEAGESGAAPDWSALLKAAGLPIAGPPNGKARWVPPGPCDRQVAWDGEYPGRPGVPVHVEAGSFRGRPVYFRVGSDWTVRQGELPDSITLTLAVIGVSVFTGLALLAARNLRLGRGDRRGAARLAGLMFVGVVATWLLGGHHPGHPVVEFHGLTCAMGAGVTGALLAALAYLALEPAVRRRWPWRLTAWARVLAGRFRDPLVGRDLLVGLVAGVGLCLFFQACRLVPALAGLPAPMPITSIYIGPDVGPPAPRAWLFFGPFLTLAEALQSFALVFVLRLLLRLDALALAAYVVFMTLPNVLYYAADGPAAAACNALVFGAQFVGVAFVLARFGLWAFVVMSVSANLLLSVPLTWDASAWYFPQGVLGALVILAAAAYGYVTATGGQRLFAGGFLGDE